MSFTRKSIADHLDSYDDEIATLQEGKREALADYRQQLADAGMSKGGIKAEIEALKVAMRRRRAIAKKGEEVVEEADVLADEIFAEITSRAPRATRVREDIEEFDAETGEVIEDQPETATEFHPPVTTREGHQGDPSPTLGERDLAEVGTGQKRAVLPQEPYTATNHQSTGVLPAGGSSPSASEIDEIANLSDEEVVPAFMKGKPGCLKLRDGHCKIGFATEALCAECADKRARAMA